jgi:hypothetical protein
MNLNPGLEEAPQILKLKPSLLSPQNSNKD